MSLLTVLTGLIEGIDNPRLRGRKLDHLDHSFFPTLKELIIPDSGDGNYAPLSLTHLRRWKELIIPDSGDGN